MPREKRTIARDSVFRATGPSVDRPVQGTSRADDALTHQTAVWLGEEEIAWLDTRCQEIKRSGWRSITRSALIRSLIRAAMDRDPQLRGVSGEAELTERLVAGQ